MPPAEPRHPPEERSLCTLHFAARQAARQVDVGLAGSLWVRLIDCRGPLRAPSPRSRPRRSLTRAFDVSPEFPVGRGVFFKIFEIRACFFGGRSHCKGGGEEELPICDCRLPISDWPRGLRRKSRIHHRAGAFFSGSPGSGVGERASGGLMAAPDWHAFLHRSFVSRRRRELQRGAFSEGSHSLWLRRSELGFSSQFPPSPR